MLVLILQISRSWYTHMNYRLVVLIRGILLGEIQRKSFMLNLDFAQEATAASLVSADMEGIISGVPQIHELWISAIEVAFGIYLLVQKLGAASFIILIPTVGELLYRSNPYIEEPYMLMPLCLSF